ncbi:UNVERIFIED_CONTAM: G-type lectin S-receptor-like serine/threonine-protein kinase SD1-1 [Sesamum calycinum]|uniref:non-specific serine/threonine protein kinase n=1 Tax=Sesamum calycinum TaxID=2727403 RepID=A0AAW2KM73_9LAMI
MCAQNPRDPCDGYGQCGPYGVCRIDRATNHEPQRMQAECLRNCICSAYANPYITNGGSGCLIWFGDLDTKRLFWDNDSVENYTVEGKENKRPIKLILISMVFGVLVSGFIMVVLYFNDKRKRRAARKEEEDLELPVFNWTTIVAATNNFSRENIIGEGGFGPVYRGNLSAEEEIAVKRLSRTSGQGLEEFKTEVILIAKLQHRNLVRLLGCCIEGEERMLIYEYLPNKSLDCFVFGTSFDILHLIVLLVNSIDFLRQMPHHKELKEQFCLNLKSLDFSWKEFQLCKKLLLSLELVQIRDPWHQDGVLIHKYPQGPMLIRILAEAAVAEEPKTYDHLFFASRTLENALHFLELRFHCIGHILLIGTTKSVG